MTTTALSTTTTTIKYESPIGTLLLQGDDEVVSLIKLPCASTEASPAPWVDDVPRVAKALKKAVTQLRQYFDGRRRQFDLELELSGTDFQVAVWEALAEIPYGETVTYAELAEMVGHPNAFRAVGSANGANPIPIVLPCHRVVASGGGLGGYGGGLPLKKSLLALEGVAEYE